MASAAESELRGGDGGRGALRLLHPILMGLMDPRPADGEAEAPPAVRIVLMNPRTGRVVMLHSGDASIISEFLTEGGGRRGPPPASKASIEAMRKLEPAELEPDDECPVCMVEIVGGVDGEEAAVREMPCKHRFHESCINKWLGMHGSCPVCRFQMPEEEEVAKKIDEPRREEEGEEHQTPRMIMSISISMPAAAGPQQSDDDDDDDEEHQQQRMENID